MKDLQARRPRADDGDSPAQLRRRAVAVEDAGEGNGGQGAGRPRVVDPEVPLGQVRLEDGTVARHLGGHDPEALQPVQLVRGTTQRAAGPGLEPGVSGARADLSQDVLAPEDVAVAP